MTALWGLLWGPWIAIGIFQQQLGSAGSHVQANDGSEVKQTIAICINCAEVAWGARGRQFKSARPDHSNQRLRLIPSCNRYSIVGTFVRT